MHRPLGPVVLTLEPRWGGQASMTPVNAPNEYIILWEFLSFRVSVDDKNTGSSWGLHLYVAPSDYYKNDI